jgi:DNA-binding beta-propeller fold protein YncE
MKRILSAFAVVGMALVACASDDSPEASNEEEAVTTARLDGAVLYIAMDDGVMDAYQIGTWAPVGHWTGLPVTDGVRGADVDVATSTLFFAHGGTADHQTGGLLSWNLLTNKKQYDVRYRHGIDQLAYGDGKVYMPSGESTTDHNVYVIDAKTGAETGVMQSGFHPHNVLYRNGHEYVAAMDDTYLYTHGIGAGKVGPSPAPHIGVRPFTINGSETRAYLTWTEYRGFSVGDIQTGQIIKSVNFGPIPAGWGLGASHGISLAPDNSEVYVLDTPNNQVRVYDASDDPQLRATITLTHTIHGGTESPCAHTCFKSGWLTHTRDGKFVLVGDAGDVIDTTTHTVVHNIPRLQSARHGFIEVDWKNGAVVGTATHFGMGY